MPVRIQRKRTKGWKMPEGAVYVGRPTLWGNPVEVNERATPKKAVRAFRWFLKASQAKIMHGIVFEDGKRAVMGGLGMVMWREKVRREISTLRGKDLCCWCPLDQPCHADVLLELANRPSHESGG